MVDAVLAYSLKCIDESSTAIDKIMSGVGLLGNAFSDLGGPLAGVGSIMTGFAAGGPAGAGIAALGQAAEFLQDSVEAAAESERVMARLRTTVENQGEAWGDVEEALQKVLSAFQSTSRFSDEELAESLATLVSHGLDTKDAMAALQTAMDTAVGSGKPLSEIAAAIGKAYEGQDTALTRLVPAVGDLSENMGEGADKGQLFQAALGLLNERYGGQALSDAQTFAGVQERMANAWDDFQETVGKVLLPALTDVMDAFMKIGKEAIGPLMDALGEVWSALFGEDFDLKAFGQFLTENVIVVLKETARFIREDVVPAVKALHDAFQTASDTIGPPLKTIADAVNGFLTGLRTAFEGFYNWLVGGSLWMDMWNQMLTIASELIGQLIGDLGTKLFDPMVKAFTTTIDAAKDLWSKGWDAIQTTFGTISDQIKGSIATFLDSARSTIETGLDNIKTSWDTTWQNIQSSYDELSTALSDSVTAKFNEMKDFIQTNLGEYAPIAEAALSAMQSAANMILAVIRGDWQSAFGQMSTVFGYFWRTIQGVADSAWAALATNFQTSLNNVHGILQSACDAMQGVWRGFADAIAKGISSFQGAIDDASDWLSSTLDTMESAARLALSSIESAFWSTINSLKAAAEALWNSLVGGSIWTDMLDQMQAQTYAALGNITGAFEDMSLAVPAAVPYSPMTSPVAASAPTVSMSPAGMGGSFSITVPVTVTLDGHVIAKTVEKRIVDRREFRERSIPGY